MKSNYYDKDVLSYIDNSIILHPLFEQWYEIVEEILLNDEFQKRKIFPHHHKLSVWDHSILVSFRSFLMARIFNADIRVCAIAGLLHDFYPWSWIYTEELELLDDGKYLVEVRTKHSLFKMHGFTHAKAAAENYVKYFPELENPKITNAIKRHMFPLNIIPPRYKEGFIVTTIDKINSVHELPSPSVIPGKIKESFNKGAIVQFFKKDRVK